VSFLEPFRGHLSPKIDKVPEELTLRYPHEGPCVGRFVEDLGATGEAVPRYARFYFTEMCSASEEGSYLRLIDSCITPLKVQGPSRICNESKEEEEITCVSGEGYGV
jgi:hypothetical protein